MRLAALCGRVRRFRPRGPAHSREREGFVMRNPQRRDRHGANGTGCPPYGLPSHGRDRRSEATQ
jgi:hypothetical protein